MSKAKAAMERPQEDAVDLVARLRAENDRLREQVSHLEIEVLAVRSVAATYAGWLDEAKGLAPINRIGEPGPVPDRLATALQFGERGAQVTVPIFGTDITLVLGQVGPHVDAARAAHVFERVEAIVDEVADQGRPGITGMFRMDLPEQIAALVWRLPDGTPVTVVSVNTKRCALRSALRAAGHQLVRDA